MRALLKLVMALCLIAGLMSGSIVHAMETGAAGEVTAATAWLHADGDEDQVPADADKNYPHHHTGCHGHDVGTPLKLCESVVVPADAQVTAPAPTFVLAAGPLHQLLRPPIA